MRSSILPEEGVEPCPRRIGSRRLGCRPAGAEAEVVAEVAGLLVDLELRLRFAT